MRSLDSVYTPYLKSLEGHSELAISSISEWALIHSGSTNLHGLAQMADIIFKAFSPLAKTAEKINLKPYTQINSLGLPFAQPLGQALRFRQRPEADNQIFLGIHMDVVYGKHAEQKSIIPVQRSEENILQGSGTADAKGGIWIMLKALECLEASPFAKNLGWEVLINPDEEIGSPGSLPLLQEAAQRNQIGLLFEPALPNGSLVSDRKGSGNFTVVVHGRSAHAGRNPQDGRNAIVTLSDFITALGRLEDLAPEITVNMGHIEGGGPLNQVPALAIGRFNVRVQDEDKQKMFEGYLQAILSELNLRDGISVELHGSFTSPPKSMHTPHRELLHALATCGKELGLDLHWHSSGGVCDGNKLAAAGLANIDSLGARGGNLHSDEEFMCIDSLAERSKLVALFLMKLGNGELTEALPSFKLKNRDIIK